MTNEVIQVKTISMLNGMLGFPPPPNPLVHVIDVSNLKITEELVQTKMSADFFYVGLKNADCGAYYGRSQYDFDKGVLAFAAPGQVVAAKSTTDFDQEQGWMLFFHPDLLKGTSLDEKMGNYVFFNYDTNEALHLSEEEKQTLNDCIVKIKQECLRRNDDFSKYVIVSCLELLLNYCSRFYERQFHSRAIQNKDVLAKVENTLKEYMDSSRPALNGIPTVSYLADNLNLSKNYLSDLLRKETGRSAKDHIDDLLVEKAQTRLLVHSEESVAEVAYALGFRYPHYFSRLFKARIGLTPKEYRNSKL